MISGDRISGVWLLSLMQGIITMLIGGRLTTVPNSAFADILFYLAAYWLLSGGFSLIHAIVDRSVPEFYLSISGMIGVITGAVALRFPPIADDITTSVALFTILGLVALTIGCLELVGGLNGGGANSFILGGTDVLIGTLLLVMQIIPTITRPLVFGLVLFARGILFTAHTFCRQR